MRQLIESSRGRWSSWRLDRCARSIIDTIDAPRFAAIRARYHDVDPAPGSSKYLDLPRWIRVAVSLARGMNLHRRRACDVLDLGTGCGYFPFVCRHYGHRPRAIDLGDNDLYNEVIELLGIDRRTCAIEAGVALPRFETRFDWVTAFMICFNNHGRNDLWGPAEWEFFLGDVVGNLLKPDGHLLLHFNPERDGRFMSPEIEKVFVRAGGSVDGGRVSLRASARG